MPVLILCYATQDEVAARRLGDYLEANLDCTAVYDEARLRPGFGLVEAAERALSAEWAIVLLSPESVPAVWTRQTWEPVFFHKPAEFGTQLGFVLLQNCRFPELLRRQRFFDATGDFAEEARAVRRWLQRPDQPRQIAFPPDPSLLRLRALVGDAPGSAFEVDDAEATAFAAGCGGDFEEVHRIDCAGRTQAGILGEIGEALRVCLPGTVKENRQTLAELCRGHRYLFLLVDVREADRAFLQFGGRASILFVVNAAPGTTLPGPLRASAMLETDLSEGLRFSWTLLSGFKEAKRFAEAVELLQEMEKAAQLHGDEQALYRVRWEQSWLREPLLEDGTHRILPTAGAEVLQLSLF